MESKTYQPNDGSQSHLKIKNFLARLNNDILEEAGEIKELNRQKSDRPNVPAADSHCTLRHSEGECKIPILKGK